MRVVELFAGVGGFRLGLERASEEFVTVFANQWAYENYGKRFGSSDSRKNW